MYDFDFNAEVEAFERRLRQLQSKASKYLGELKSDVASIRERDPAARTDAEVLLLYPGLHAVMAHRVANKLYREEKYFADLRVHPNDEGFAHYFSNLYAKIKEFYKEETI